MSTERAKMRAFLKANRKIRLEDVAGLANTTPATVSRIVAGVRRGLPATAIRIALAFTTLGLPIDAGRILIEPIEDPASDDELKYARVN